MSFTYSDGNLHTTHSQSNLHTAPVSGANWLLFPVQNWIFNLSALASVSGANWIFKLSDSGVWSCWVLLFSLCRRVGCIVCARSCCHTNKPLGLRYRNLKLDIDAILCDFLNLLYVVLLILISGLL